MDAHRRAGSRCTPRLGPLPIVSQSIHTTGLLRSNRNPAPSLAPRTAVNLVGLLVGYINAKLLLNGHDHLHSVEAVQAQVVQEMCLGVELRQKISKCAKSRGLDSLYLGDILDLGVG